MLDENANEELSKILFKGLSFQALTQVDKNSEGLVLQRVSKPIQQTLNEATDSLRA